MTRDKIPGRETETTSLEALNLKSLLDACNRCGFCQDVCPTYRHSRNELEVARGRIRLIRLVLEGKYDFKSEPDAAKMVDSCLLCKACTVNCPASVQTDQIVLQARQRVREEKGFSFFHRVVYQGLLTSRQRLNMVNAMLRLYERSGLRRIVDRQVLEKASGRISHLASLVPAHCEQPAVCDLSFQVQEKENAVYKVGLFVGCATKLYGRSVIQAAVSYLQSRGCSVHIPEIGCCGGPQHNAGDERSARELARKTVDRIFSQDFDFIVSDCSTCVHTLLQYTKYFPADDPVQDVLRGYQNRIMDLNTFILEKLGPDASLKPLKVRATYHDPCHAVRGIGVREAPRNLLKSIPDLELAEMERADSCCGGAGSYCFTHPDMSARILKEKTQNILAQVPDVVLTSCPACTLQLQAGLRQQKMSIPVKHPVELLAKSAGLQP
jgi:glycolate oxidase iron-sulfur subunit